jgi:hypothetical protein
MAFSSVAPAPYRNEQLAAMMAGDRTILEAIVRPHDRFGPGYDSVFIGRRGTVA